MTRIQRCEMMMVAVVAGLLLSSGPVRAQQADWTGGSFNNQTPLAVPYSDPTPSNAFWSDQYNWLDDNTITPLVPGAGEALYFNAYYVSQYGGGGATATENPMTNNLASGTAFGNISFGNSAGGSATWVVNGNSISTPSIYNNAGSLTFNLPLVLTGPTTITTDNTGPVNAYIFLGGAITGSGNLTISGYGRTRFNVAETAYTGNTIISGGDLSVTIGTGLPYGVGYGDVYINSGGILQLENNSENINALNGTANAIVDKVSGSGTRGIVSGYNNDNGDFEGSMYVLGNCGTLNFTKTGTGTQVIGGTVGGGYSGGASSTNRVGGFFVNAGTLTFNATVGNIANGDVQESATITVASGATLQGTGNAWWVQAQRGGTLQPGIGGLGTMTAQSNLTLVAGANFAVTLDGTSAGQFGQMLVQRGTVALGSGSYLDINLGYSPALGSTFDIVENQTGVADSGNFNGYIEGATFEVGATEFEISYIGLDYMTDELAAGAGPNDVVLTVVPEPSSLLLAGLGLLGAWMLSRRVRR